MMMTTIMRAFIDSTVQEKNMTYPTDAKLHKKIVKKVLGPREKTGASSASRETPLC